MKYSVLQQEARLPHGKRKMLGAHGPNICHVGRCIPTDVCDFLL